jgi:putative tryptophan/tyrosine transport system substrate-binding protein
MIKRRDLIIMLGSVPVAWPRAVRAQQHEMPVVGFLNPTSEDLYAAQIAAFRHGLADAGFIEGENLRIEYRWAEGHADRLPQMAADLVKRRVNVIAATGEIASAKAAQAATKTIPTVFTVGADPVTLGLVTSWNRPGGNMTGVVILAAQLVRKLIEISGEIFPTPSLLGLLVNPENEGIAAENEGEAAARQLGRKLLVVTTRAAEEIEPAVAKLAAEHAATLAVAGDPLFLSQREKIFRLAARYKMPLIWSQPDGVKFGGLVGFGNSVPDAYREAGVYVSRILKGEHSADMPVIQASKVELWINLKVASVLGLTIPSALLARADEVIE